MDLLFSLLFMSPLGDGGGSGSGGDDDDDYDDDIIGGDSGGDGGGDGGSGDAYDDDENLTLPFPADDGVRTEYECRLRFPNEVYIDRFLLVLAGASEVSGTVVIKDERSNRQISKTFVAQQGMNTIRFKERLRSDSVKVIVVMGQREGRYLYTYDAWVVYDLLERMGGARR
jgi:hypothetical protein